MNSATRRHGWWVIALAAAVATGAPVGAMSAPAVVSSTPADNASQVLIGQDIAVRFSERMEAASLSAATVTLQGPDGPTPVTVTSAADGRSVAIHPQRDLYPGSHYTLFVADARGADAQSLPMSSVAFTTQSLPATRTTNATTSGCESVRAIHGYSFCHAQGSVTGGIFTPGANNTLGRWRLNTPQPPVLTVSDLPAGAVPAGATSIIGRVLRIDDAPVADVTVSIGTQRAQTDAQGRFVLTGIASGHQVLLIDGSSANHADEEYGQFIAAMDLKDGQPNAVPYNLYLPRITARDKVAIPSPTTQETIVTNPAVPGLEIHIPAGAVFRDRNGKVITQFAIVPMPVDRSPIPVPDNFPVYFSTQPGGATVEGLTAASATGLRVVYPNYMHSTRPKQGFWYYDAQRDGWRIYTSGHVSADHKAVLPDTALAAENFMPEGGPSVGGNKPRPNVVCTPKEGDPVACVTGTFIHNSGGLFLKDNLPLDFSGTYLSGDTVARSFGHGFANSYEWYLYSPQAACYDAYPGGTEIDLVTGQGGVYPFFVKSGTALMDQVLTHTGTPSPFYGAKLYVAGENGANFIVETRDGTIYVFQNGCPSNLLSVTDRFGNSVTLSYSAGLLTQITSTSGRTLTLGYNANNFISKVTDNSGRQMTYGYTGDLLTTVTYPDGTTEQYGYDGNSNMQTVTDRNNNTMVTNHYDTNGRVDKQTYADSTTYNFGYTLDASGNVTATDVTNTRGYVKHLEFDAAGYPLSVTQAYGTASAQTTTYVRGQDELVTSETDPLGRVTSTTYDNVGDVLTQTYLAGTAAAATYTYTYTPTYHQLASVTDPLNHTTVYGHDGLGCLNSITDALGHTTNIHCNSGGQPQTITDALGHTTTIGYLGDDVHTVTDALHDTTTYTTDTLGRVTAVEDPLGRTTRMVLDTNGRVLQSTDPMQQTTTYTYYNNGNLKTVTDPNGGKTQYGYDARNRKTSRTDALGRMETWSPDGEGNVLTYVDRNGNQTTYQYDALNRPSLITYGDGSTVTPTFDAGNRLTQVVDSVSGTITRGYDDLHRTMSESTPQGTVSYVFDAAGRRTQMTAASQLTIYYGYDDADRLKSIGQGNESVSIGYYDNNQRDTLTLPNGVVTSYSYDNANRVKNIAYSKGSTTLSSIAYGYDAAGQRISQTGGFATAPQPTLLAGADYNRNNEEVGSGPFEKIGRIKTRPNLYNYDANGNLTGTSVAGCYGCGGSGYQWDARNRLVEIGFGTTTDVLGKFTYDSFGRRTSKTDSNGNTTTYLYDGDNPIQETQGSTVTTLLTGLGIDERYARDDTAYGRTYFLTDALGSTLALTDTTGAVKQTYAYEPYGEVAATGNSDNPYQYTGRENDGSLYYYRARYYSPTLKRFISEDPMGLAAGLNEYGYALGDPLMYSDPLGLDVLLCHRPADLPPPLNQFNHYWFKTGAYESGMGGACPVPGQGCIDTYGSETYTKDHSGQALKPNATCIPIPVNEQCVDTLIKPGQPTGPFVPPLNDCQTFAATVIGACTLAPKVLIKLGN